MPEYDIDFAQCLCDTAHLVLDKGINSQEEDRTVLYLSLLSVEISLKAILEKAGKPVSGIKARSHDLSGLLKDVCQCTILSEVTKGKQMRIRATEIRSVVVSKNKWNGTIGGLIELAKKEASKYPNGIRYGDVFRYYPADIAANMAKQVATWGKEHWNTIQIASSDEDVIGDNGSR
ncbi:MAG: hypothetical protein WC291_01030 [Thermodesulfovibrionales bacterium]|jgi:HEPN domain-containing protein